MAPFMPFVSEHVYQHLRVHVDPKAPASVHFCDYPQVDGSRIDVALEERTALVRSVVALDASCAKIRRSRSVNRSPR